MTTPEFDFREMIQKDRDERVKRQFEGTFLEYLKLVKSNP